jgi:hypothetical protein
VQSKTRVKNMATVSIQAIGTRIRVTYWVSQAIGGGASDAEVIDGDVKLRVEISHNFLFRRLRKESHQRGNTLLIDSIFRSPKTWGRSRKSHISTWHFRERLLFSSHSGLFVVHRSLYFTIIHWCYSSRGFTGTQLSVPISS